MLNSTENRLFSNLSNKKWQKLFFYQQSRPLYELLQEEIESLEFVRGVNFPFIDLSKNSGTKYLLILQHSREEICNSEAPADIATAGRHLGLSTTYIQHKSFHRSNLGRDVEFHNSHMVSSNLPVMWCKSACLVHS